MFLDGGNATVAALAEESGASGPSLAATVHLMPGGGFLPRLLPGNETARTFVRAVSS
jgi:hypothetical protein